jgi:hypothetical protein
MIRRHMCIALGCLALSVGLVSPAEAGGRRRPAPPPATTVTVRNTTSTSWFTQVQSYSAGDPAETVGPALQRGAKVIAPGRSAVFPIAPGTFYFGIIDATLINLNDPGSNVFPSPLPPKNQSSAEDYTAVRNKNVTLTISTKPNATVNDRPVITYK